MLNPYVAPLLNQVFGILCDPNYPENDYLMRMVLRILIVAQDTVLPHADTVTHAFAVLRPFLIYIPLYVLFDQTSDLTLL